MFKLVKMGALRRVVPVIVGLSALGACGQDEASTGAGLPESPSRVAISHEIDDTADVSELFTKSATVIVGEVTDVAPGRTWGAPADAPMTDRLVTVKVTEVLKGEVSVGSTVRVVEGYWNENGDGVVLDGMTWNGIRARGIYFLKPIDLPGDFRFTNSHGRLTFGSLEDGAGPSGQEPFESVWRSASEGVAVPDVEIAFVKKAGGAR